jgi:hypothetical protein
VETETDFDCGGRGAEEPLPSVYATTRVAQAASSRARSPNDAYKDKSERSSIEAAQPTISCRSENYRRTSIKNRSKHTNKKGYRRKQVVRSCAWQRSSTRRKQLGQLCSDQVPRRTFGSRFPSLRKTLSSCRTFMQPCDIETDIPTGLRSCSYTSFLVCFSKAAQEDMLRVALPNKGALSDGAIELVQKAGYTVRKGAKVISPLALCASIRRVLMSICFARIFIVSIRPTI